MKPQNPKLRVLSRALATIAAVLPLIGLMVPVVEYSGGFSRMRLLDEPVNQVHLPFVAIVFVLGVLVWTRIPPRIWGVLAMIAAAALVSSLFPLLDMWLCWDGMDSTGKPVGGCEETVPALGFWASCLAGALLLGAGGLALPAQWPSKRPTPVTGDHFRADGGFGQPPTQPRPY